LKYLTYGEFCIALKDLLGKDDYQWLIEFVEKHREKEIQHAENSFEIEKIEKLKAMSTESYLFHNLSDQDFEKKLRHSRLTKHDAERIRIIVAKLRSAKVWLDETLV
jgi:hypothetical protein